MSLRKSLLAALLLGSTALPAWAADYYVAPLGAPSVSSPDGSRERPFGSIDQALGYHEVRGGDTIFLMDGSHGALRIKSTSFDLPVTIRSETPKGAHLNKVHFDGNARNITLKDLRIWRPEGDGAGYLVRSYSGAEGIILEDLDIRSRENATNYLDWDITRWTEVVGTGGNGIDLRSSGNTVRDSVITGVRYGILVGSGSVVENNVIDGFTADGLRGCQDTVFRGNTVKNSINLKDGMHRDMIQCYAPSATSGLTLEGNYLVDWDHADTDHPLRGAPQGIGMFDGPYGNLRIVNNVVLTTHAHGISVYGSQGALIANNTVVNSRGLEGNYPWLMVTDTKDGEPSRDAVIANNLAMRFTGSSNSVNNIKYFSNAVVLDPTAAFEDFAARDLDPLASTGFVDAANASYAPATDILGNARPAGAGPDIGAYEVGASGGSGSTTDTTTATADTGTSTTDTTTATADTGTSTTDTTTATADTGTSTTGTTTATADTGTSTTDTTTATADTGTSTTDTTTVTADTSASTSDTTMETTVEPDRSVGKWVRPRSRSEWLSRYR